ncbi:hypothetical protein H6G20_06730 [Desertifilum sp. FACHB-1129]|uniref:Uncharacterized protein n=2 Tax=Desertifilum tharense IPPAS B-1220 TaxID=1781255 RepID=A0A1E5QD61_9CYAN|nr:MULTISPECIES: hypothetical protein [Desertifilum]MDA0212319.1 hypothetical protein [Cyanobacteria bacterium FC1]MDI9636475.1 hypothetical protein [Geitlerinema splendidum]MBD2311350.1 hypothetical protein [Desertifilum sp. FACHB-1129]MBD2321596.1 hypothetical protein [Desertifilum sp. FACHB-866]MBD2331723.1 hypothetical protein [Desertifilum sp. FACHB-868]
MFSKPTSQLLGIAIGWMYRHRDLLSLGYSGKDPTFSQAKQVFLEEMRQQTGENMTDEVLLEAFQEALNRV